MAGSLLPNEIVPEEVPFMHADGTNNHVWWLLFYNLMRQSVSGSNTNSQAFGAQINSNLDNDADAADVAAVGQRVTGLERLLSDLLPEPIDTRALLLSQADMPQDPAPRAQPVTLPTIGASPWTFQAPFDGSVVISGGTVSAVSLSRDGTTFYALPTAGQVTVSRLDLVKVTYSVAPTVAYFPR